MLYCISVLLLCGSFSTITAFSKRLFEERSGRSLSHYGSRCSEHEFQCQSIDGCINLHLKCDGFKNCPDGSDEDPKICQLEVYACHDVDRDTHHPFYIPGGLVCDGKADCPNGADETMCSCAENEFECGPGECILKNKRCDGVSDCNNDIDEDDCKATTAVPVSNTEYESSGESLSFMKIPPTTTVMLIEEQEGSGEDNKNLKSIDNDKQFPQGPWSNSKRILNAKPTSCSSLIKCCDVHIPCFMECNTDCSPKASDSDTDDGQKNVLRSSFPLLDSID